MSKCPCVSPREVRSRSLRFENLEDRRLLAVVTVDTNQDVVDFNDGVISLREAIFATNLVAGADEIQFDFGHDGPETIVLTMGELAITDSLTITGPGAELLTIDASGNDPTPDVNNGDGSRVFTIDDGNSSTNIDVVLFGQTLTGGDRDNIDDGPSTHGGAIYNNENLTVTSCILTNNAASLGGGIFNVNPGTATVTNSTLIGNEAKSGGGIYNVSSRGLNVTNSTLVGNVARSRGGGICNSMRSTANVTDSTLFGNVASLGGGISNIYNGTVNVTNSTLSGNTASLGGGIVNLAKGTVNVTNSTLVGNVAESMGGGIFNYRQSTANVISSIVAGNRAPDDANIHGLLSTNAFNLIDIDPLLGPLADNGGPTRTHALLPGSPAINAGDLSAVAGVDGIPKFDQRGKGFDRIYSGRIDIGAYERQEYSDLNLLVDTLEDESDGDYSRFDLSLREAIELANANPAADTIDFDPLLAGGTITLTMGELAITDSLTINGLGAELLTIDASGNDPTPDENNGDGSRVFNINDGVSGATIDVVLIGQTLTGGDPIGDSLAYGRGGAIFSTENLSVVGSTISDSSSSWDGGGIYASGTVMITGSTISGNIAHNEGGGVWASGITMITESTISDNSSLSHFGGGGGVYTSGTKTVVTDSMFSENSSGGNGGGLFADSELTMIMGSTFSGNSTDDDGGGIWVGGIARITASMITGNSTLISIGSGGGVFARGTKIEIADSRISNNSTFGNGGGLFADSFLTTITNSAISGNSAGNDGGGVFVMDATTITGSTITANTADGNGGGISASSFRSVTTILGSTISDNLADGDGDGGGIYALGTTTIMGSAISDNSAARGGGIYAHGTATVTSSTISSNLAGVNGGGVWAGGVITVTGSTISGNSSDRNGGGIYVRSGKTSITNTTISGNSAKGDGGGLLVITGRSTMSIAHSTVAFNQADSDGDGDGSGGGIFVESGIAKVDHSIVANNTRFDASIDEDISANSGNSLFSFRVRDSMIETIAPGTALTTTNTIIGLDPLLGPLANNGGSTLTHALLPGSRAINAGDPTLVAGVGSTPKQDQRGFPYRRISGGLIDIGAYESQPLPGDFNLDGFVNNDDLAIWKASYGVDDGGDADGDGQTSGIDFLAWQITRGSSGIASIQDGEDNDVSLATTASHVQEACTAGPEIAVASESPTDVRLDPRLVDLALAVELNPSDRSSLLHGSTGRREVVVMDEVFQAAEPRELPTGRVRSSAAETAGGWHDLLSEAKTREDGDDGAQWDPAFDEVFALL